MQAHTLPPFPYLESALGHLGIYYWFLPAELVWRGWRARILAGMCMPYVAPKPQPVQGVLLVTNADVMLVLHCEIRQHKTSFLGPGALGTPQATPT